MPHPEDERTVEKLLRQQAALAAFGSFAFREPDILKILNEAARICAASLGVPFCKICRYRAAEDDLLIEAGAGWDLGVVGRVVSQADESSPQGRAYVTGEPVVIRNLMEANNLSLPGFYPQHGIISTVDVVIPGIDGAPYGVLEIDSPTQHLYDIHDINFLTGFANVLAEAVSTATKNQALRALLAEKNLLAEELQHRVRNNLQTISGMLAAYARSAPKEELAGTGIGKIVRRVVTLAQIYDSLLGVGLSSSLDVGAYLKKLCSNLPALHDDQSWRVDLECRAATIMLEVGHATALGLVVSELVSNSYGHAFPGKGGTISVILERRGPVAAQLTIRDDGIGFVADIQGSRRGLGLVKRLVEQVQGTFEVHSGDGTLWSVSFPVPAEAPDKLAA